MPLLCTQMDSGLPAASKPKGIRARLRWMLGKQSKQAIAKQQVGCPILLLALWQPVANLLAHQLQDTCWLGLVKMGL